jgi:L-cysteine S-thiosulfotransferase
MRKGKLALGGVAAIAICAASQLPAEEPSQERVQEVVDSAFANAPDELQPRLEPDEIMQICNASRNSPGDEGWDRILELASASIVYPEDGNLMGDWENGERLAQSGYGMRFTDYPPARETGGNCYACHQLTEAEVSYGTIGPSLRQYGELRDYTEEAVRAAYDKIYNPHAALPCSMMPRFGTNEVLTPEQIRDIVALLMDPESPVNK